jgi:hypothetical protein
LSEDFGLNPEVVDPDDGHLTAMLFGPTSEVGAERFSGPFRQRSVQCNLQHELERVDRWERKELFVDDIINGTKNPLSSILDPG